MDNVSNFKSDNRQCACTIFFFLSIRNTLLSNTPKHSGISQYKTQTNTCLCSVHVSRRKKHPFSPERLHLSIWGVHGIHSRMRWQKLGEENQTHLYLTWSERMYGRPTNCLAITASTGYSFCWTMMKPFSWSSVSLSRMIAGCNFSGVYWSFDLFEDWCFLYSLPLVITSVEDKYSLRLFFHECVLCKQ